MSENLVIIPEFGGEEATCPNCGRDHIPDEYEGQFHDTCVECLDGHGGDE